MPIHAPGLVAIFDFLKPRKPVGEDSTVDEIIGVVLVVEEFNEEENGFHVSPQPGSTTARCADSPARYSVVAHETSTTLMMNCSSASYDGWRSATTTNGAGSCPARLSALDISPMTAKALPLEPDS